MKVVDHQQFTMEASTVSQDAAADAGMIIAELHQAEKIETVVVAGDFIELGSAYDTSEQPAGSAGSEEEVQVLEVVSAEHGYGAAADSGMEVSTLQPVSLLLVYFLLLLQQLFSYSHSIYTIILKFNLC